MDMGTYNYVWSSDLAAGCGGFPYDNGVKMFVNVTLDKVGAQTIIAADTLDGSKRMIDQYIKEKKHDRTN
ncbi:MAG: hypothetical protein EB168_07715 [Euryarchaeota archaeon]|nr:hypothetical protein [Euryarchaeota archaeon]